MSDLFQWMPVKEFKKNKETERSPEAYLEALAQFDVEHNARYRPWGNEPKFDTFCNIFVTDCLAALCVPPTHWVDSATGANTTPFAKGALEQSANALIAWFEKWGMANGWKGVNAIFAKQNAADGKPTVVTWTNPNPGPCHVAMLLPNGNIAQAGRQNFFDQPISHGFGNLPVHCYTHD